jgi:hypothetical protein
MRRPESIRGELQSESLRFAVRRGRLARTKRENVALELARREPDELLEPVFDDLPAEVSPSAAA